MSSDLRLLLLDDDPADALLIRRALEKQFPAVMLEHVDTRERYLERLSSGAFDAVLADSTVTGCEGLKAFHLAREQHPSLPFISISGDDTHRRDVHGLAALGITAAISKSDLSSLGPILERALGGVDEGGPSDPSLFAGYRHLVTVVKDLSMARDLPAIMAVVRTAARALTGADGATFVLRDGDLCHYADEDAIGPLWKGQRFPMSACISGWAMMHRQPAVVEDIYSDPRIPLSAYEPTFVRSVVMVPIRAMDPIGAIGVYRSQARLPGTEEIRLLQALADTTAVAMENVRIYRELESRVRQRTADLEAFSYAVSHDLRAPLRHVHGFASILLEDHGETMGESMKEGLDRIVAAASRMGQLIDGLLELSRTSQAPLKRLPVDLARLAREIADENRLTSGRAVELVIPSALPVEGDPALLRAALQNLVGNAWKFTGRCASPRVEIGVEQPASSPPVYFVRDNGVGFDPAHAGKLFGIFQRLHAQQEFPGTGVGLATVQRIIQKHGGRIWATAEPGAGATFSFTLNDR